MPLRLLLLLAVVTSACADDDGGVQPVFPADYETTYTEVRDCRTSGDHDLNHIRVLADQAALGPYLDHDAPFPEGSVIIKEEYDFGDNDCTGDIKQWTVMQRLPNGTSTETLDWYWQRVDASRNVLGENTPRCWGCHSLCTPDVGGYDFTCTLP